LQSANPYPNIYQAPHMQQVKMAGTAKEVNTMAKVEKTKKETKKKPKKG
jgi:hypothetical protein